MPGCSLSLARALGRPFRIRIASALGLSGAVWCVLMRGPVRVRALPWTGWLPGVFASAMAPRGSIRLYNATIFLGIEGGVGRGAGQEVLGGCCSLWVKDE